MYYIYIYIYILVVYRKSKYSKVLYGDVHGMTTGRSYATSKGLNNGTF